MGSDTLLRDNSFALEANSLLLLENKLFILEQFSLLEIPYISMAYITNTTNVPISLHYY